MMAIDYKSAGVDVEAGYESVRLIRGSVERTYENRPEVLGSIGGFSGLYDISAARGMDKPRLVAGTDGVGTKVKIAFALDRHDTVGIDCVAMCVNDIICCGAEPLFFLDYIACGHNYPKKIASIVSGVSEGCVQAGAALLGGETAEHPGLMPDDEYDLAGFAVGIVDESRMINGRSLVPGDALIGLASSGPHSNGYSLIRKVLGDSREALSEYVPELDSTLGEALLTPTVIYVGAMKALSRAGVTVKAASHITGGGFYENIPRMLPDGIKAQIETDTYDVPEIFRVIQRRGGLTDDVMYGTFNMGLGMIIAVDRRDIDDALRALDDAEYPAYLVGACASGDKGVELC